MTEPTEGQKGWIEQVEVTYDNGVKYKIHNPEKIDYVARNAFMQHVLSTMGEVTQDERPLEEIITSHYNNNVGRKLALNIETVMLAMDYIKYRDRGARLPKFSRWAAGMFASNKELAKDLAGAGKLEDTSSPITFTDDKMTMLRCADTPHFRSCLGPYGGYNSALPSIMKFPGIAMAYMDDNKTKRMRGRTWLHTARVKETGEDCIVVCNNLGSTMTTKQVVDALRAKGFRAGWGFMNNGQYSYMRSKSNKRTAVEFIDCPTKQIHHDLWTWTPNFEMYE